MAIYSPWVVIGTVDRPNIPIYIYEAYIIYNMLQVMARYKFEYSVLYYKYCYFCEIFHHCSDPKFHYYIVVMVYLHYKKTFFTNSDRKSMLAANPPRSSFSAAASITCALKIGFELQGRLDGCERLHFICNTSHPRALGHLPRWTHFFFWKDSGGMLLL